MPQEKDDYYPEDNIDWEESVREGGVMAKRIILTEEAISAITDDLNALSNLFDAVDDYLGDHVTNSYPPGHCNPDKLEDVRETFNAVWNRPGDDARDLLAKAIKEAE